MADRAGFERILSGRKASTLPMRHHAQQYRLMSTSGKKIATSWQKFGMDQKEVAKRETLIKKRGNYWTLTNLYDGLYTRCLRKKTVQNCFCQNFVKFPSVVIIFGR